MHSDEQQAMSSHVLQSELMVMVEFLQMYYNNRYILPTLSLEQ
jgi:hypothetical protein